MKMKRKISNNGTVLPFILQRCLIVCLLINVASTTESNTCSPIPFCNGKTHIMTDNFLIGPHLMDLGLFKNDLIKHIFCDTSDPCHSDPCQNGGTCMEVDGDLMCRCDLAFEGMLCEIELHKFFVLLDSSLYIGYFPSTGKFFNTTFVAIHLLPSYLFLKMIVDPTTNKIYILASDRITSEKIFLRTNYDGSEKDIIFTGTRKDIIEMTLDVQQHHIYWIEHFQRLHVTHFNGTYLREIDLSGLIPFSIYFDTETSDLLLGSQINNKGRITKENMVTGKKKTVIRSLAKQPISLLFISEESRVYWTHASVNRIFYADIDTEFKPIEKTIPMSDMVDVPFALSTYNCRLYFLAGEYHLYAANDDGDDIVLLEEELVEKIYGGNLPRYYTGPFIMDMEIVN
ncbi:uncharacterized protein LOC121409045 [Lytechinus variegatus]|uniref:uncharacterized protein LOC121409045 n=1 Tax=Lytechinus variegatus TaxID=7654 RepID=UPI001BB1B80D|nr:uncharacterized protein LOC121409045 [Lytechinus variegatus]